MKVKILEEDKEKINVELVGESPTLTELLAEQVWEQNGESSAIREHPFMKEPRIIVIGNNPKKLLEKAAESIEEQCTGLKEELKKAISK